MLQYLLVFLAGLAGSVHCIGMCGGFACALGRDPRGAAATLRRHLVYNLGRATTYCFLGVTVGFLGLLLCGHEGEATAASLAQRTLAVVSGLLIVFAGLQFFGFSLGRWQGLFASGAALLTRALGRLLKAPGSGAPLAFGVLNGLLPCPLVYAFVAQAAGSGGPLPGFLTMAVFSLATFPAMLLMGGAGLWLRSRGAAGARTSSRPGAAVLVRAEQRQQLLRLAGGLIVLLGLITFARGVVPMSAHLHGL
jgi:sulfite exporter TauE/SafE